MAKEKLPAILLYVGDWLRDEVAGCSLAAQGLWLRMLFMMHDSERYGYLSKDGKPIPPGLIAQRCASTLEQYFALLTELTSAGVPSTTPEGIIFSRRMTRDICLREKRARAGKKGGLERSKRYLKGVGPPSVGSKSQANVKQNTEDEDEDENEKGLTTDSFKSKVKHTELKAFIVKTCKLNSGLEIRWSAEWANICGRALEYGPAMARAIVEVGWQMCGEDDFVRQKLGRTPKGLLYIWGKILDNPKLKIVVKKHELPPAQDMVNLVAGIAEKRAVQ